MQQVAGMAFGLFEQDQQGPLRPESRPVQGIGRRHEEVLLVQAILLELG